MDDLGPIPIIPEMQSLVIITGLYFLKSCVKYKGPVNCYLFSGPVPNVSLAYLFSSITTERERRQISPSEIQIQKSGCL